MARGKRGFGIDGQDHGVNDAGRPAAHADRKARSFYSTAAIQLNHYYTRSNAELMAKTAWTMVHGVAHLAIDGQLDFEPYGNLETMLGLMGENMVEPMKLVLECWSLLEMWRIFLNL